MALLERLFAEARQAAAEALAADGYFSAKVDSKIERTMGEAVARPQSTLARTRTSESMDLDVTGAAARDAEGRSRVEAVGQT